MEIPVQQRERGYITTNREGLEASGQIRTNNVDDSPLDSIEKGENVTGGTSPNMTAIFHAGADKRLVEIKYAFP